MATLSSVFKLDCFVSKAHIWLVLNFFLKPCKLYLRKKNEGCGGWNKEMEFLPRRGLRVFKM